MSIVAGIVHLLLGAYATAVVLTAGVHNSDLMPAMLITFSLAELMLAWAVFRGWSAARSGGRGVLSALVMLVPVINVLAAFPIVGGFPTAANDRPAIAATPIKAGAFRLYPWVFVLLVVMIPTASFLMDHIRSARMPMEVTVLALIALYWLTRTVVLTKFLSVARQLRSAARAE